MSASATRAGPAPRGGGPARDPAAPRALRGPASAVGMLALQAAAGNRAVVQRMLKSPQSGGKAEEEPFLSGFAFGADSDSEAEEEAPRPGMSEALRQHKEEQRAAAALAKHEKAERARKMAERQQALAEERRVEAAKAVHTHYVYPSEMTGDIWHAAAALTLNPRSTVHFVSPRDVENHEYEQHLHALNRGAERNELAQAMDPHQEGIRKAKLGRDQLRTAVRHASARNKPRLRQELAAANTRLRQRKEAREADPAVMEVRQQMQSRVRNAAHVPKDRAKWIKHRASNEKALADFGLGNRHQFSTVVGQNGPSPYRTANVAGFGKTKVAADHPGDAHTRHVVENQKETTSAIMAAMGPGAVHKDKVIKKLRAGLAGNADDGERAWVEEEIAKIRTRVATLRKDSKKKDAKLLMINRRHGHENMQHNTSDEQFADLTKWYGETHLAGKGQAIHAQATMGVATGAAPQAGDLDLYDQGKPANERPDATKRRTALLWARIADLQKEGLVHGLIGGRSGSMDIAAFMGVNAYSWDDEKPDNVDYQRLKKTEPIMTVGHMTGDDHKLDQAHVKGWMKPPPSAQHVALRKKLGNLDAAISQLRAAARTASRQKKAALRLQIQNTVAHRKQVAATLLATP